MVASAFIAIWFVIGLGPIHRLGVQHIARSPPNGGLLGRPLAPVDVVSVVHAVSGGQFRRSPVAITVVVAPRKTGSPVVVSVTIRVVATVAVSVHVATPAAITIKIIAVTARLANGAVFLHFVAGAEARCSVSSVISIAAALHFMTGTQLGCARTASVSHSSLCMCERHRAQQQRAANSYLPYHQVLSL
jgi:hypothetical protein